MTTPMRAPGSGLIRAGRILTIVGGIILVLGIAAGTILSVVGFSQVTGVVEDGTRFTGSTELTLETGQQVQLYVHRNDVAPLCEVTDENGDEPVGGPSQSSTINGWRSFDMFTATRAGTYTITCSDETEVLAAEPLSIGGIFSAVGGILIGVFVGGLGLLLLVVGVILLLIGRSQAKRTPGF